MPVLYTVYASASSAYLFYIQCFTRAPRVPVLYTIYTSSSSACFIHGLYECLECLFYIRFIRALRVPVLYTVYASASSAQRNSQGQNRQNTSSKSIQKIIDQKIWIDYYFSHIKSVQKISKITKSRVALDVHSLSQVHVHKRAPISYWTI